MIGTHIRVTAVLLAAASAATVAAAGDAGYVQDGCPASKLTTQLFLDGVNFSFPGLHAAKKALDKDRVSGDYTSTCNAVSAYYAASTRVSWLRQPAPLEGSSVVGGQTDDVRLSDTYNFYGEVGKVPRNADGGLDWNFTGPVNDVEFMYALNRHGAWRSFNDAWETTGNSAYASAFDKRVADWTAHNLPAPHTHGGGQWRTLEAGIRSAGSWPDSFFGFQHAAEFKSSTRCAMVAALAEHGRYLHAFGDAGNSNWRSMQYNGLGTTALTMPELNHAAAWYAHAEGKILEDMQNGVYPDGVEDEETSHYHGVALKNFDGFYQMTQEVGMVSDPRMATIISRMFNYVAYTLDSTGISPLNGDSDTDNNTNRVLSAAARFSRPDWLYIATNGKNGTQPPGNLSVMFPWAGQLISRNGWAAGSQWSWFKVGPFGSSSHGHQDRTHLSIRIGGTHLLVDAGRFSYSGTLSKYRSNYGIKARAHNVLILDGLDQVQTPAKAKAPLAADSWSVTNFEDRARDTITFADIKGSGSHTRSLVYQRARGVWVVVDRVQSDRERHAESLWHAHPHCSVQLHPELATASIANNESRLGIDLVQATGGGVINWVNSSVVIGQDEPVMQGWFSPT